MGHRKSPWAVHPTLLGGGRDGLGLGGIRLAAVAGSWLRPPPGRLATLTTLGAYFLACAIHGRPRDFTLMRPRRR